MILGGPLPHILAAKQLPSARRASQSSRRTPTYRGNAQALAQACMDESLQVMTNGTDNHLLLLDVAQTFGLTGRQAESALRTCRITPTAMRSPRHQWPLVTSGRAGHTRATTLGMGRGESKRSRVHKRCSQTHPVPPRQTQPQSTTRNDQTQARERGRPRHTPERRPDKARREGEPHCGVG